MIRVALLLVVLLPAVVAAGECYEASVVSPSPVMGNNGEVLKLSDGTLWEVMYEYEYMYEYSPTVLVCPGKGKIAINGKMLNVQYLGGRPSAKGNSSAHLVSEVIESRIDGDFQGWEGGTICKLLNGQIWQQVDGRYTYRYKYGPRVMIIRVGGGYEMQVEGMDDRVRVTRLK